MFAIASFTEVIIIASFVVAFANTLFVEDCLTT